MILALIITLIVLGIAFLLLEIFFLPGITIAGIAGGLCLAAAAWLSFSYYGATVGWYTVVAVVVIFSISVYLFIKTGVMDKISLRAEIKSTVEGNDTNIKVGDRGVSLSRLAPIGNAEINGKITEVKSIRGFVDADTDIEVIAADKQEILVRRAQA